jgi:3-dehydroquinate synthase
MTNGQHANESRLYGKSVIPDDLTSFLSGNGFTSDRVYFLTDTNVRTHCFNRISDSLPVTADHVLEIPAGESSKDLEVVETLILRLAEAGCNRDSLLVNVGGGVVTDVGGFLASVYKRGIPFVNIPTSLLGMVDASIGGKTGVDAGSVKNIIGTIMNPLAVMIDTVFLDTLPDAEWRNGLSEMIKHALISDAQMWEEISAIDPAALSIKAKQEIKKLVPRATKVKQDIVDSDMYEQGNRIALNFGHTAGHAIESVFMKDKEKWSHGKAVAAGIVIELIISMNTDGFPRNELSKIAAYLKQLHGLDGTLAEKHDEVMQMIRFDKKQGADGIRFCFIKEVGNYRLGTLNDTHVISSAIKEFREFI